MSETRSSLSASWRDSPQELKLEIAGRVQPYLNPAQFNDIFRSTVTQASVVEERSALLNQEMFHWLEAEINKFTLHVQSSIDESLSPDVTSEVQIFRNIVHDLALWSAIDTQSYDQFMGALPTLPSGV